MKKNLKPCVYKQMKHRMCDIVLFVERSNELLTDARLSTEGTKPKGNRVLIGREVEVSRPETR